jgi:XTP/dITP diphosphohydrolase
MKKDLVFISGNKSKIEEAKRILDHPFEAIKMDLLEVQALNIGEIVEYKVKEAFKHINRPVFVDDVGLYVNAWKGFPGPFIKFIATAGGMELLLRMMKNEIDRGVVAKSSIGYFDGHDLKIFTGEVEGTLSEEIKGENGFGWDTVFIPANHQRTYAQMTSQEKDLVSPRRKALNQLKNYLISTK